jgi:hypothetical protein
VRKIYVTSVFPPSLGNTLASEAQAWLAKASNGSWQSAPSPGEAEFIVFLEQHWNDDPLNLNAVVWARRWTRKFRVPAVLYHDWDWAYPLMPGLYPGLGRQLYLAGRTETWSYIKQLRENAAITSAPPGEGRFLYSFVGNLRSHPIRGELMKLTDSRALLAASPNRTGDDMSLAAEDKFFVEYASVIAESKFVLCPRGISPTSYRLLEAMKAGRCPVIISDDWVPPAGPAWNDFSIVVPEAEVKNIPTLLRQLEPEAERRGAAARRAWDEFYSEDRKFDHFFSRCSELAGGGGLPPWNLLKSMSALRKAGAGLLFRSLRSLGKTRRESAEESGERAA